MRERDISTSNGRMTLIFFSSNCKTFALLLFQYFIPASDFESVSVRLSVTVLWPLTAKTLRDHVTTAFDLLTMETKFISCHMFNSSAKLENYIRLSLLELWRLQSDGLHCVCRATWFRISDLYLLNAHILCENREAVKFLIIKSRDQLQWWLRGVYTQTVPYKINFDKTTIF